MSTGVYKHYPHQGFKKGHKVFIKTRKKISKSMKKWHKNNPGFFKGQIRLAIAGKNHPRWKGGRNINDKGYVLKFFPNHPFATKAGYIREHRLIMEKCIGCYLKKQEIVHHINGIKTDNRIKNLMLLQTNTQHKKLHYMYTKGNR